MKKRPLSPRSSLALRSLMGLLVFSSAPLFAQSGGGSGGATSDGSSGGASSSATGSSQGDRDVDAARRATSDATSSPGNSAVDGVDRGRQRNMPGARPGDAPAQRPGAGAVAQPDAGGTDADGSGSGASTGSRPGVGLGGLPSDGASTTSADTTTTDANGAAPQRDSRTTVRMIGETSFAYRDRAMQMVEGELASGGALGSSILRGTGGLSGPARIRLNESMTDANEARTELAKAISRARSSNESRWNASRSEVAERYEAYAKALENARAAAVEAGIQLPDQAVAPTSTAPQ